MTDTDLLIELDDDLYAAIAARASASGRTMEEEAIRLLYLASELSEENTR